MGYTFEQTRHLTPAQRDRRIIELLAKGAKLLKAKRAKERGMTVEEYEKWLKSQPPPDPYKIIGLTPIEYEVYYFIRSTSKPSPKRIQEGLGLSKSTVYRVTKRLIEKERIVRFGNSRNVYYRCFFKVSSNVCAYF